MVWWVGRDTSIHRIRFYSAVVTLLVTSNMLLSSTYARSHDLAIYTTARR